MTNEWVSSSSCQALFLTHHHAATRSSILTLVHRIVILLQHRTRPISHSVVLYQYRTFLDFLSWYLLFQVCGTSTDHQWHLQTTEPVVGTQEWQATRGTKDINDQNIRGRRVVPRKIETGTVSKIPASLNHSAKPQVVAPIPSTGNACMCKIQDILRLY